MLLLSQGKIRKLVHYLLLILLIQGCSCENIFGLFQENKLFPPDTSCNYTNPNAEYDETIIEICDGIDNNCNCISKPIEEQDTNGDLVNCSFGDDGVD